MRSPVHLQEMRSTQRGVSLSGGKGGMPQQFLDGAQIGAPFQKVRGECVAQPVRGDPPGQRAVPDVVVEYPPDAPVGKPPFPPLRDTPL